MMGDYWEINVLVIENSSFQAISHIINMVIVPYD